MNGDSIPTAIIRGALVRPTPTPADTPGRSSVEVLLTAGVYRPIQTEEEPKLVKIAQSVGRMQLRDEGPNGPEWVGLGTAFVVAPGVIATNCHVISDFVHGQAGNWTLKRKNAKNFAVDFSDEGVFSPEHGFKVVDMFSPPEEVGLDVVFLSVEARNANGNPLPDPLPLSEEKLVPSSIPPTLKGVALIGYPSPSDVRDPRADEMYRFFGKERYNKFVIPGGITTVQACKSPLDIVFDTVTTTSGQSGSPLIDRESKLVLGVHTCCADYELRAPNQSLPPDPFPCASKRDTPSNQAVSTWSIWNEPNLAKVLRDRGITPSSKAPDAAH